MTLLRVTNDAGRTFNVRIVRSGERYGLADKLVHTEGDPLVEFWDATYENDPRFTVGRGQFVARYTLSTLTERAPSGLALDMGIPVWTVTAANVAAAVAFAQKVPCTNCGGVDEGNTCCPPEPEATRYHVVRTFGPTKIAPDGGTLLVFSGPSLTLATQILNRETRDGFTAHLLVHPK